MGQPSTRTGEVPDSPTLDLRSGTSRVRPRDSGLCRAAAAVTTSCLSFGVTCQIPVTRRRTAPPGPRPAPRPSPRPQSCWALPGRAERWPHADDPPRSARGYTRSLPPSSLNSSLGSGERSPFWTTSKCSPVAGSLNSKETVSVVWAGVSRAALPCTGPASVALGLARPHGRAIHP